MCLVSHLQLYVLAPDSSKLYLCIVHLAQPQETRGVPFFFIEDASVPPVSIDVFSLFLGKKKPTVSIDSIHCTSRSPGFGKSFILLNPVSSSLVFWILHRGYLSSRIYSKSFTVRFAIYFLFFFVRGVVDMLLLFRTLLIIKPDNVSWKSKQY